MVCSEWPADQDAAALTASWRAELACWRCCLCLAVASESAPDSPKPTASRQRQRPDALGAAAAGAAAAPGVSAPDGVRYSATRAV